jgi:hypothetical protein
MNRTVMKAILILAAEVVTAASFVSAQDIAGDWEGTLHAGADLRLVLRITKGGDGALKATLDSVDQGANGIPVSSISLKDSKLSLGVDAVHGTYEGTVAADGKTIGGTWSQGQPLPLEFKRAAAPVKTVHKPAKPSDIDGAWMGTLDAGASKLRVVFHIVNTEDGLIATLDSPDQGMKGMPVTTTRRDGAALKMEVKPLGGVFEGKIAADRTSIEGTWTQGGGSFPLVLKVVKDQAGLERSVPAAKADVDFAGVLRRG